MENVSGYHKKTFLILIISIPKVYYDYIIIYRHILSFLDIVLIDLY